jgi:L-aspartate oxidase
MARWRREADVVVIGSGAAGITTALTAAGRGLRVLMVTKDLAGGASPLAQGGLAAAIGPGDSPQAHARDTEVAGAGLCDRETVAALAAGSPAAIEWLVAAGARLERRDLRLEGGHAVRRIVHSGDDASGAEVHRALLAALLTSPVEILDHTVALDLAVDRAGGGVEAGPREQKVAGLMAATISPAGELCPGLVSTSVVVLAAGGLGQAFATTSNPAGATGDGIALAARAGAVLRDLEFIQFHPTVLWKDGAIGQRPLITEALRGAGAVLRDLDGRPVMAGRHPRGDLAPRDIVAAAIHEVATEAGAAHLWLDATALGRATLEDGFPTVTKACREQGVDPVTDLIPVAPGAHYSCGGIAADLHGQTSIPGLYAVGETASTGVHGANRLASNSLVEAVIMGRNAGESISSEGGRRDSGDWRERSERRDEGDWRELGERVPEMPAGAGGAGYRDRDGGYGVRGRELGACAASRAALAAEMSRYAGVVRDGEGLTQLLRIAAHWAGAGATDGTGGPVKAAAGLALGRANGEPAPGVRGEGTGVALDMAEAASLRAVSVLIAAAARQRTESRGCHRRRDAPQAWAQVRHTLLRWTPDGLAVSLR